MLGTSTNLLPVIKLEHSTEGPHDSKYNESLNVTGTQALVIFAGSKETFKQVKGLTNVHAFQHLQKIQSTAILTLKQNYILIVAEGSASNRYLQFSLN